MPEKVAISQIANRYGVSVTTVSLVLNDRPGISSATRRKVIRAAREMGYSLRAPKPGRPRV
jgi:DNA-binding LacI/PurR family transcriptional regulator